MTTERLHLGREKYTDHGPLAHTGSIRCARKSGLVAAAASAEHPFDFGPKQVKLVQSECGGFLISTTKSSSPFYPRKGYAAIGHSIGRKVLACGNVCLEGRVMSSGQSVWCAHPHVTVADTTMGSSRGTLHK